MEHFVSMLPMMMASLRVHVPDSHKGISIPDRRGSKYYKRIQAQNPIISEKQRGKRLKPFALFFFILPHQGLII